MGSITNDATISHLPTSPSDQQENMTINQSNNQNNQLSSTSGINRNTTSAQPECVWEQIRLPTALPERDRLQGVQNYSTWYARILNRLRHREEVRCGIFAGWLRIFCIALSNRSLADFMRIQLRITCIMLCRKVAFCTHLLKI